MESYKKNTVVLILASVLTAGVCMAEGYLNSILSIKIDNATTNSVNVTLQTKTDYDKNINLYKKDASTYIITLPEVDSQLKQPPKAEGNIQNIEVKTLPYTATGKGYTKITITTAPNTNIQAGKELFVPPKERPQRTQKPNVNNTKNKSPENQKEVKNNNTQNNQIETEQEQIKEDSTNTENSTEMPSEKPSESSPETQTNVPKLNDMTAPPPPPTNNIKQNKFKIVYIQIQFFFIPLVLHM